MAYSKDRYHDAKAAVRKEYEDNRGKLILVSDAYGTRDDQSIELSFNPPLQAELMESLDEDMFRTVGDFMDPYFNIRPLEDRPELAEVFSLWVYGTSHNLVTGKEDGSTFTPTGTPAPSPPVPSFIDWTNA